MSYKSTIINIIAIVSCLIGAAMVLGEALDTELFLVASGNYEALRFLAGVVIFMAGLVLYFSFKSLNSASGWISVLLPPVSLLLVLIVVSLILSVELHFRTGIETVLVNENDDRIINGEPIVLPLGALVAFGIIAFSGMLNLAQTAYQRLINRIGGVVIIGIGVTAILGHIINVPALYYSFDDGVEASMSLAMAFVVCVLGLGFLLLSQKEFEQSKEQEV